jgi:hypothetical protein
MDEIGVGNMKSLEERIQALEDARDIANVKTRYLDAADGGWDRLSHDADALSMCLADNCTWTVPGVGTLHGKEAVQDLMRGFRKTMPFAYHVITNPFLEVEGDTARGNWHLTWQGTDRDRNELWLAGVYDDTFVRTREGWRIQTLNVKYAYFGARAQGWEKLMREYLLEA